MQDLARIAAENLQDLCLPQRARALFLALLLLAPTLVLSPRAAASDREPPIARGTERPRFLFDSGVVWRDGEPWVEILVAVPYTELMFRPADGHYRATYDLIVVLTSGGRQLSGDLWEESADVRTLAEARESAGVAKRTVTLRAKPGKVRVEVTVSEQSSGNEGRLTQELAIRDPKYEPLQIGKIWFSRCASDSSSAARPAEGALLVGRRFGAATGPVCVWTCVYAAGLPDTATIGFHWKVLGERNEMLAENRMRLPISGDSVSVSFRLPVETFWLGGYDLWVEASGGKKSVSRVTGFDMDETTVSLEHNPDESIALVRYIATAEEIATLEDAPPERRMASWDEFWKRRDPTPDTEQNEFKEEFFERVRFANENYSTLGPGWRTDRGMIYIQYGPPDQIESYPHNTDLPPYEVWSYYDLQKRFVFVDYDGFGRYELYTPGRQR
jgi:GWxTD domain-containing protein